LAAGVGFGAYLVLPMAAPSPLGSTSSILVLGVVLGLVVGFGTRLPVRNAPYLGLGSALGVVTHYLVAGLPAWAVVAFAVLIGAEVVGVLALWHRIGLRGLTSPWDVLRFAGVALPASAVFAALATSITHVSGQFDTEALETFNGAFFDDAFGLLVIAPAVMTLRPPSAWPRRHAFEFACALALSLGMALYIFVLVDPRTPGFLGWPYLVALGPIWAAVRLGVAAAAPIAAVAFWLITLATLEGSGAFTRAGPGPLDGLAAVELFVIVMAVVVLFLATLRDSRLRALERVEDGAKLTRELIDGSQAVVFAKDYAATPESAGEYVLANQRWCEVLGLDRDRAIGHTDLELFEVSQAQQFRLNDAAVLDSGEVITGLEHALAPDGQVVTYATSKFPLRDSHGRIWGVGGVASDITDLSRAQAEAERSTALLTAVFDRSPTPAVRVAVTGDQPPVIVEANRAWVRLMGGTETHLLRHVYPDDVPAVLRMIERSSSEPVAAGSMPGRTAVRLASVDGTTVWAMASAAALGPVEDIDTRAHAHIGELVMQFEDVTAQRAAEEALTHHTSVDAVTGLPNRVGLRELATASVARLGRYEGAVTLLLVDVDRFKDLNDSMGHAVGDAFLAEVGRRLSGAVGPADAVARLAADEFVVLAEDLDSTKVATFAHTLQVAVEQPWSCGGRDFHPHICIGVARTTQGEVGPDELLRRADLAMHRAKAVGPGTVAHYDEADDQALRESLEIQQRVRSAIEADALAVHYQPVVDLVLGHVTGLEALVRLRDADGRLIPPGVFIPQAQAHGLIDGLGDRVLARALRDLRELRARGFSGTVAVNVSPIQVRAGFADALLSRVAELDVDQRRLVVEVTESALLRDPDTTDRELTTLGRAGVGVALDDFGTGYSSLSWLTRLPVTSIKIDRSFTSEVGVDPRKTAIVRAVIEVAHEVGMSVVAEGVETEAQRRRLLALQCDRGQGFLFGRPVPRDEAEWSVAEEIE
jgi:diguanylate cyclase (GGDEF)-like protein/PAS domain S-box-containing protein